MTTPEQVLEKFVSALERSLIDNLRVEIKKMVRDTIQIHVDGLNKRLDSLARTMDMWKSDFDSDRESIQGLRIDSGRMNLEIIEIRKVVDGLPRKVEDKVQSTVSEAVAENIPKAVSSTFDVTSKKVNVEVKPKKFLGIF